MPFWLCDASANFQRLMERVMGDINLRDCLIYLLFTFVCCLAHRGSTVGFLLLQCSSGVVRHPRDLKVSVATHFCRVLIFASS